MSDYIAEFQPFYANGWENQPSENTPIMGEVLDAYDETLQKIEEFLANIDLSGGGSAPTGDYALLSEAGYSISGSVASDTGFLTLNLLNKAGETLSTKTFYLPFGQMFNGVTIADGLIQFKTYAGVYHKLDISPLLESLEADIANVESIAKGKNRARVFSTTEDMNAWLSDANNMGVAMKGDNLYIVELDVPDWWIAEVLEEPNASGMYYEIAPLETQKVDLSNYISQDDVVDDLTSTETQKPLSANQGNVLNGMVQQSLQYRGAIPSDADYETLDIGVWHESVGNDTYEIPQHSMLYKPLNTSLSGSIVVCFMKTDTYGTYTLNKSTNKYEKLALSSEVENITKKDVGYTTCELGNKFSSGTAFYMVRNGICYLTLELTPTEALVNGDIIVKNIPKPPNHFYTCLTGVQGNYTAQINAISGNLVAYYPGNTFVTRFDCTISYPVA